MLEDMKYISRHWNGLAQEWFQCCLSCSIQQVLLSIKLLWCHVHDEEDKGKNAFLSIWSREYQYGIQILYIQCIPAAWYHRYTNPYQAKKKNLVKEYHLIIIQCLYFIYCTCYGSWSKCLWMLCQYLCASSKHSIFVYVDGCSWELQIIDWCILHYRDS